MYLMSLIHRMSFPCVSVSEVYVKKRTCTGQTAFVSHLGAGTKPLQAGRYPRLMFIAAVRGLDLLSPQIQFGHSRGP